MLTQLPTASVACTVTNGIGVTFAVTFVSEAREMKRQDRRQGQIHKIGGSVSGVSRWPSCAKRLTRVSEARDGERQGRRQGQIHMNGGSVSGVSRRDDSAQLCKLEADGNDERRRVEHDGRRAQEGLCFEVLDGSNR